VNSFALAVNLHLLGLNSHRCYHSQGLVCCMQPFRFLVCSNSHIYCCELKRSFL